MSELQPREELRRFSTFLLPHAPSARHGARAVHFSGVKMSIVESSI